MKEEGGRVQLQANCADRQGNSYTTGFSHHGVAHQACYYDTTFGCVLVSTHYVVSVKYYSMRCLLSWVLCGSLQCIYHCAA